MTNQPGILLLHGALGSAEQLKDLSVALKDLHPMIVEFTGHGKTPDQGISWSIDYFADHLERLCSRFDSPVYVFGYSMGGYVALSLSMKRPDLFRGIITLGTKFDWTPESARKESSRMNAEKILEKVPVFAADLMKRHGSSNWKMVLKKTADLMLSLGDNPALRIGDISSSDLPVLCCLGEKDNMVNMDETLAFMKIFPDATFRLLPDTPHPIEQVSVSLLASVISGFVNSNREMS
ncbi:MAG: alpha/beta fold hydrolase [Bacteroidetes bacterium]|nr:alpha/beta fold hydrolase [Bacteroidota bacterium]